MGQTLFLIRLEAVEDRFYWMLYLCIINSLDLSKLVGEILNENDIDCCYLLWRGPAYVIIDCFTIFL